MYLLRAKYIELTDEKIEDVFIINCLDNDMVKSIIEHNNVLVIMNDNKTIRYINSRYIMSCELYDEKQKLED